jgi:hypothetical protein
LPAVILSGSAIGDRAAAGGGYGCGPLRRGMAVPVDLPALIQRIVIAPKASSWLSGLVSSILPRYGLSTDPVSSELSRKPDW